MSESVIRTAISLSGTPTVPSANAVQWTEDGQIIAVTRNKIFILVRVAGYFSKVGADITKSPTSGIQIDPTALVKQEIPDGVAPDGHNVVQWVRTIVEWETIGELRQWAVENQGSLKWIWPPEMSYTKGE